MNENGQLIMPTPRLHSFRMKIIIIIKNLKKINQVKNKWVDSKQFNTHAIKSQKERITRVSVIEDG